MDSSWIVPLVMAYTALGFALFMDELHRLTWLARLWDGLKVLLIPRRRPRG